METGFLRCSGMYYRVMIYFSNFEIGWIAYTFRSKRPRSSEQGRGARPIFFSDVKVPFFNNHVNTFYLAWHKVESCFRCIKFACSVMWVIVFHDISWCMYVNSLVVCSLISNRTILWIILGRILSTAFVHIHENEWISADALSEKP